MKSAFLLSAAALCAAMAWADIPAGYYDDCDGKTKSALKNQLYTIVKNHTKIKYGNGKDQTWGVFFDTDVHPDGYWWDIYTTNEVPVGDGAPDNNTMNKEHTFPKSWWGGGDCDAYCDVMHLIPTNSVANSTRSNWPYAEVATPKSISSKCPNPRFKHGTPKAGQGGGAQTVFEPDDEFKGDLARTYFYMVTCYQNMSWQGNGLYTAEQGSYPTLQPWAIEMLLRWHREDPVSDKERDRNEGVYKHQHNRNPFIDHPEMVEHIWGDKMEEAWTSSDTPVDPPVDPSDKAKLTSPLNGDWYTFPSVTLGESASMEIPVAGTGFKHNLTARISGDAASLYMLKVGSTTLDAVSISVADVESSQGYMLTVVYTPASITPEDREDNATLTISCSDLPESVSVNLQGRCIAPLQLDAVTLLPVENLSDTRYTLHWLPCAVEPDYYTITRKIYDTDNSLYDTLTYEVPGSETSLAITDRDPSKAEALSVSASKGNVTSPQGNEIVVAANTSSADFVTAPDTAVRYFDAAGFELPNPPATPGVYIVRIGTHTAKTVIINKL